MLNRQQQLDRMKSRTLALIADVERIVCDIEWWNANRLDAPPFDVGADKTVLHLLKENLKELESNPDRIVGGEIDRIIEIYEAKTAE